MIVLNNYNKKDYVHAVIFLSNMYRYGTLMDTSFRLRMVLRVMATKVYSPEL